MNDTALPEAQLIELIDRLEESAARLRDQSMSAEEAAAVVDECARAAAQAAAELDRVTRGGGVDLSAQLTLPGDAAGGGPDRPAVAESPAARATSRPRADAVAGYPDEFRLEVETYLKTLRFGRAAGTGGLEEAMRYSLLAGGKRIRPVLALASARALALEPTSVLPLAASIELIHTYSLIHDDLPAMDDDDLRRGRPTCHVTFGEDVAILAGDALYAEAFHLLLAEQEGDPARVNAAACELAAATGVHGMVGGQYLDVAASPDMDRRELRELHGLKTGRLIEASVECVCLLSGTNDSGRLALRDFASELGVLFQIVDDILDVTGTDAALGKPRGSDERLGKLTYVSAYGLSEARKLAGQSHEHARAALAAAAPDGAADQLARITDFIYTRTS